MPHSQTFVRKKRSPKKLLSRPDEKNSEASLEDLLPLLVQIFEHYLKALSDVDFSQVSEDKKASLGFSLLEKLLKDPR